MSDDADFVIVHWFQNYLQQPVAMVGPNRASREEIKDFFAPEMSERFFAVQDKGDLSWVAGGALSLSYYWSTPNNAVQKPAEFVSSIKSTLDKQGVDYEALISEAGDGLVEGKLAPHQMARMVGPDRWRLSHTPLKRDEGAMALSSWAEKAGLDGTILKIWHLYLAPVITAKFVWTCPIAISVKLAFAGKRKKCRNWETTIVMRRRTGS